MRPGVGGLRGRVDLAGPSTIPFLNMSARPHRHALEPRILRDAALVDPLIKTAGDGVPAALADAYLAA